MTHFGARVEKFCGCCSVTGGTSTLKHSFKYVVEFDVLGAFTRGLGDSIEAVASGCHRSSGFIM